MKLRVKQDYAELRRKDYPDIGDQLDALWKGGTALEEMARKVAAIKEKYPKPTGDKDAQR